jgi:hypothetical protein
MICRDQAQTPSNSNLSYADRMVRNDLPGSVPDIIKLFFFNITNLEEVRVGQKPRLQEVGPYVYRVWRVKEV